MAFYIKHLDSTAQRYVYSASFIHIVNHSYKYAVMDIYFLLWLITQCYFILFLKLLQFGHWELFRLEHNIVPLT